MWKKKHKETKSKSETEVPSRNTTAALTKSQSYKNLCVTNLTSDTEGINRLLDVTLKLNGQDGRLPLVTATRNVYGEIPKLEGEKSAL